MVPANNSKSSSTTITVSAPGKLLLAGGYLVLESPHPGVVIGVDKRFYCTVQCQRSSTDATTTASNAITTIPIAVKSPQFQQEWNYTWDRTSHSLTKANQEQSDNPFCEKALRLSMLCLLDNNGDTSTPPQSAHNDDIISLTVTIRGDNDFYSLVPHLQERHLPRNLEGALQLPPFLPVARDDQHRILKTGLGSSACLVTSVVAAMVHVLLDDKISSSLSTTTTTADGTRQIIFRLAQIAHCHAQGKVGSGFDVASACFGSHIYERFPNETIADLLSTLEGVEQESTTTTSMDEVKHELCSKVFDTQWQGGLKAPLHLPSFLQVMLADVSGGSESPSMARKVLAWKKDAQNTASEERKAIPHWNDLAMLNPQVGQLWQALHDCPQPTEAELTALATTGAMEWKNNNTSPTVAHILHNLHTTLQETRVHLKAMGEAAQVPIEPDEQSDLANATLQLPGVVAALVPGAGGYDALACVYINHESVRHSISQLWSSWKGQDGQTSVCPLTVQAISFGEGVRVESTKNE